MSAPDGAPALPFVWMYYHLQNEKGESSATPNACRVQCASSGSSAKVTLRDVLDSFPLAGTSSFHFRFEVLMEKVAVFLDLTNPSDSIPLRNGNIVARVLRLGETGASVKRARAAFWC